MACRPPSETSVSSPFTTPKLCCCLLFIWNNNMSPVWLGQQVIYTLTDPSLEIAKACWRDPLLEGREDIIPAPPGSLCAHSLVRRG